MEGEHSIDGRREEASSLRTILSRTIRVVAMDVVIVFKHSRHDDTEIRYSLRSIDRYAPWVSKVWILGDRPAFLSDSTALVELI
jgi:hypothetical protein